MYDIHTYNISSGSGSLNLHAVVLVGALLGLGQGLEQLTFTYVTLYNDNNNNNNHNTTTTTTNNNTNNNDEGIVA